MASRWNLGNRVVGGLRDPLKRLNPDQGLLAGLWQFPDTVGHLSPEEAVAWLEGLGLHPNQLERMVERKHIFTHIQWNMRGFYLTVSQPQDCFVWMDARCIQQEAALPTAYRQFWEEINNV